MHSIRTSEVDWYTRCHTDGIIGFAEARTRDTRFESTTIGAARSRNFRRLDLTSRTIFATNRRFPHSRSRSRNTKDRLLELNFALIDIASILVLSFKVLVFDEGLFGCVLLTFLLGDLLVFLRHYALF